MFVVGGGTWGKKAGIVLGTKPAVGAQRGGKARGA